MYSVKAAKLCQQLPLIGSSEFDESFSDELSECLLVSYLSAVTKVEKFMFMDCQGIISNFFSHSTTLLLLFVLLTLVVGWACLSGYVSLLVFPSHQTTSCMSDLTETYAIIYGGEKGKAHSRF